MKRKYKRREEHTKRTNTWRKIHDVNIEGYIYRGEIQMKKQSNKETIYTEEMNTGGDTYRETYTQKRYVKKRDVHMEGKINREDIQMKKESNKKV